MAAKEDKAPEPAKADKVLTTPTADAAAVPKAFPYPGDTQSQGTRHPKAGFISAGVAADLEMYGSAVDPATGKRYTRDDWPAST